jgi:hypothetical protein
MAAGNVICFELSIKSFWDECINQLKSCFYILKNYTLHYLISVLVNQSVLVFLCTMKETFGKGNPHFDGKQVRIVAVALQLLVSRRNNLLYSSSIPRFLQQEPNNK